MFSQTVQRLMTGESKKMKNDTRICVYENVCVCVSEKGECMTKGRLIVEHWAIPRLRTKVDKHYSLYYCQLSEEKVLHQYFSDMWMHSENKNGKKVENEWDWMKAKRKKEIGDVMRTKFIMRVKKKSLVLFWRWTVWNWMHVCVRMSVCGVISVRLVGVVRKTSEIWVIPTVLTQWIVMLQMVMMWKHEKQIEREREREIEKGYA